MHLDKLRKTALIAAFSALLAIPGSGRSSESVRKVVVSWQDTTEMHFLRDPGFFAQGWNTLPQVSFWKQVINMSGDSCIVNIASCRKPVGRVSREVWMGQTESEKVCYKDSVCTTHCLEPGSAIFVTAGKGEFYEVKKTLPLINTAIESFEAAGCDPWYAQTILLIESPGKLKVKSYVGASGPFQLMPSVARRYGLRVTKYVDERSDIRKSARAAARLINTSCIPYIRRFLDEHCVEYKEHDLWFRLLVLHAYHAGAGNVRCVIDQLKPSSGGIPLMQQVWSTTCGGFKNESQNYSQIALASWLNFSELIDMDGDTVYLVRGDKLMHEYHRLRPQMKSYEAHEFLQAIMAAYEKDFIDEMIPYDDFMFRIGKIRAEFTLLARLVMPGVADPVLKAYPSDESHITLVAAELTKRRRYQEAIRLLRLNLDLHPNSADLQDRLSKTYLLLGDRKSAELYARRASTDVAQPIPSPTEIR
jgi:hypothetical protein